MANTQIGLIGRKLGMTQIFDGDGNVVPCTVIQAGPCTVAQVKRTTTKDGYDAIQLGFGGKKAKAATKAEIGHGAKVAEGYLPAVLRELRLTAAAAAGYEQGTVLTPGELFANGEKVDITGISKGRGTAGVMKKYHFKGFIRTHGTHEYFRHGGSIGTRLTPGMTLKGKKMGGRMGNVRVTVQNMKIARVDAERNLVYIAGGVPGAPGALVTIRKAVKHGK